jgi:hypothetical protein
VFCALPPECSGLLALLALILLPGLLLVRAPWTVVPALSVAFWTLSWWWVPLGGRSRALQAALVLFGVLALLRVVPRHTVPPPPGHAGPEPPRPLTGPTTGRVPKLRSAPSLVIVTVALAAIVPWPLWPHAPGREMAFHTTSARLAVWRDGLPMTHEPLLPLSPFGAHAPALPTLAADVSLLSGLDPGRSVAAIALLSAALLLVGLFAVLAARLRPAPAALGALWGLAAAPWPGVLALWGEGGSALALALGLSAAALLIGHWSRPSAVAAGMLLAAAALSQPALTVVVGLGVAVALRAGLGRHGCRTGRLVLAFGVALVLVAPAGWRLAQALSPSEALSVLTSLRPRELADFALGSAAVALATFLATRLVRPPLRLGVLAAALVAVSATILLLGLHTAPAPGQLAPATLRALARLAGEGRPLQAVCAPEGLADWVPALAGRPTGLARAGDGRPWVPPVFRDESRASPPRSCSIRLDHAARRR